MALKQYSLHFVPCPKQGNKIEGVVLLQGVYFTNINHKGLQRTATEYAGERRIYKDLISKNEK